MTVLLCFQVREQDGVDAADGIDTLLVYLLAELEDAPRLTGFAEGPQQAAPALVADLLQRKGQSDTLAQLYAGAGQPAAGLALWKVRLLCTLRNSSYCCYKVSHTLTSVSQGSSPGAEACHDIAAAGSQHALEVGMVSCQPSTMFVQSLALQ